MTLKDLIAEHTATVFLDAARFAESISYTPEGGIAVDLTADVGEEKTSEEDQQDGRTQKRIRTVLVNRDPAAATGGVANPALRDTVTIDGVVYAVEAFESQDDWTTRIRVVRIGTIDRNRSGYRRSI